LGSATPDLAAKHLQLLKEEVRQAEELDDVLTALARSQAKGLIVFADPLTFTHRQRMVQMAAERGLSTVTGAREFVDAGGLMSYGPSFPEMFRQAAMYVDKLLNGAKAAELPVEQPTRFELVVGMKTAKSLGVTIPQSILLRADTVLE